ncbi:tRNA (uridine(54)-C5)-methyltransferase TrmA [Citrobacter freundii]
MRLQSLMTPFYAQAPEVFRSPVSHYRMRAEFRLWHDGDDLYHIMFDSQTKNRIRVDSFPAASELINTLMTAMIDGVRNNHVRRQQLFRTYYLTTLSDQSVVSMLYHKNLDDEWRKEAEALRDALRAQNLNVHLIGRATKTKIELDQDYIDERLPVAGKEIIYRQVENSFTQPNAAMNIQMLEWAIDVTRGSKGDLLELYCGNGNFSLALAQNFNRVLATEIAKPSVAAAQYNIAANHIDNVQIIRMAAEEFTQAMNGVREFNRLQGIDLKSYQCETIFVDPPRSGLDSETEKMVQAYPRILYISCNPETLCKNLETLSQTHNVSRLALFDQFPYTHHMECGVLLTKK